MFNVSKEQMDALEAKTGKPAVQACPAGRGGIVDEISTALETLGNKLRITGCRGEPLRQQQRPMSCAQASTSMVIQSVTGERVSEEALRNESAARGHPPGYDPVNGTMDPDVITMLNDHGVKNGGLRYGASVADVKTLLTTSKSVMVGLGNPGHWVICDGVKTNKDGSESLLIRDPLMASDQGCRELGGGELESRFSDPAANAVIIPIYK